MDDIEWCRPVHPIRQFAIDLVADIAAILLLAYALHFRRHRCTDLTASGVVVGLAAGRGAGEVRWQVAGRMVATWLLTLPSAAEMGALAAWVASGGTAGTLAIGAALVVVAAVIYALSRRTPVTAGTSTSFRTPRRS